MSSDRTIARRTFLGLALGGAAAAVGAGVVWPRLSDDETPPAVEDDPTPSPDDATAAIGRRYLAVAPAGTTAASLRIAVGPDVETAWTDGNVEAVAAAVTLDFERGATIELDGWVLSETECRLAALAVA